MILIGAWQHQAITWINVALSSVRFQGAHDINLILIEKIKMLKKMMWPWVQYAKTKTFMEIQYHTFMFLFHYNPVLLVQVKKNDT